MIKYFSAFSGMGTDTFVFKRLKIDTECIGWSEIDNRAITVHNFNHPECKDKHYKDMRKIEWEKIPDFDILFGGFPCQSFSNLGKKEGFNSENGELFFELVKALKIKQPEMFLFENVKHILYIDQKQTIKQIIEELNNAGYIVQVVLLNTKDFGIPQNRERVWFVGKRFNTVKNITENTLVRTDNIPFYNVSISDILKKDVPLIHMLKDGSFYKRQYDEHYRILQKQYGNDIPIHIADMRQYYHRAKPMKEICPTIISKSMWYGIIPLNRRLTPEEMLLLQGFNENEVKFPGNTSLTARYNIIGNGWSIVQAEYLIKQILQYF